MPRLAGSGTVACWTDWLNAMVSMPKSQSPLGRSAVTVTEVMFWRGQVGDGKAAVKVLGHV